MTFLIIGSILAGLVAFSSGLFVYLKNRTSPLNTAFFLMNICVAIWNTGELLIYTSPDNMTALLRDRISYLGGIFIPPLFVRLIFSFLNVQDEQKYKKYFSYSLIASFIIAIFNFTPLFLKSVTIVPYTEKIGPLYYVFMAMFVGQIVYCLSFLFRTYRATESPVKKNQLRYACFGLSMAITAATFYFVTLIYPSFPKIHFITEILYFCIFAYAIAKHRLMDITVVFKWSSIIGGVAICLTGIYLAGLVITEFVLSRYMNLSPIALRIIVVAVMAVTLTPFRSTIKKILLSIFLKREQETEDELDGLSRYLRTQLNFDEDSLLLVTELESIMRTQCVTVTVYDGKVRGFRSEISVNFEEQLKKFDIPNSAILAWLEEHQRTLVKSWFDSSKKYEQTIIAECEMLCAEIVVPMIFEEQAIGFIALGERKWRQYTYNVDEICLLERFANDIVVALKNALEVSHIPKETIKTVKIHHFPNGWTAIDGVQDDDKKKDGDDDDDPVIA